jgi:hypothetical protein
MALTFSIRAAKWFREGDHATKRQILEIAGSNPVLEDRKLSIEAGSLFRRWRKVNKITELRAVVQDVRTLCAENEEVKKTLNMLVRLFQKVAPQRPQDP